MAAVRRMLMADYNVVRDELLADGVAVTLAAERPGRRNYPMLEKPFGAVTLGAGVVIATSVERLPLVEQILRDRSRDDAFTMPVLGELEALLRRDGQSIAGPNLRHICSRDRFRAAPAPVGFEIELLEDDAISALYEYPGFHNALAYDPDHPRRDALAAVARQDGGVVAVAGASMDSPELWQIGIDVVAGVRRGGIGAATVSRLTEAIFDAGMVPYYSTSTANIASRSLAQSLGFWPAWTELYARDL